MLCVHGGETTASFTPHTDVASHTRSISPTHIFERNTHRLYPLCKFMGLYMTGALLHHVGVVLTISLICLVAWYYYMKNRSPSRIAMACCSHCGSREEKLLSCSSCRQRRYCSKKCQMVVRERERYDLALDRKHAWKSPMCILYPHLQAWRSGHKQECARLQSDMILNRDREPAEKAANRKLLGKVSDNVTSSECACQLECRWLGAVA